LKNNAFKKKIQKRNYCVSKIKIHNKNENPFRIKKSEKKSKNTYFGNSF